MPHAGSSLQRTGFSLVVACRFSLSSCDAQAPGHMGSVVCGMQALLLRPASSVVVVCGLSCHVACGIFVPDPGSNPCPLHWKADSSPLGHEEVPEIEIIEICLWSLLLEFSIEYQT